MNNRPEQTSTQQSSDPALVDDLLTVPVSDSNLQAPEKQRLPFDPSSDHNLPTLASSAPKLQVAEKQQQPPLPKRRPAPRSRIMAIISGLIVLLVLVILASSVYLYNNHQASVNALAHSQTATAIASIVRPTQAPTHAPTVASTRTAKPQNGLYIAGTYNGSMVNEITQETTTISVFLGQSQGNAALSGTFVFRSPSKGS